MYTVACGREGREICPPLKGACCKRRGRRAFLKFLWELWGRKYSDSVVFRRESIRIECLSFACGLYKKNLKVGMSFICLWCLCG